MIRAIRDARPLGGHAPIDVTIGDGVITGIHPAGTIAPGDGVVDLEGRWLLPGLWDEHVHLTQWAQHRRRVDLSTASSAREAADRVADAAAVAAPGETIVGAGFRDGLWPDAPTAALLDAAAPEHPVVLVSADVHCAWLNSSALSRYGADVAPAELEAARASGLLREEAAFAVTRQLDGAPDEVLDGWVAEAAREAAARGVVGVVDLEMRWNLDDWRRRVAGGFDALRVEFGVYPQHLDRAIEQGLRSGAVVSDTVSVGPLKVITDGSLNTRTAYCCDPYPDETEHPYGLLTVPPCELHPLLARASEAGFELAVHAIGDGANKVALDVFQKLGRGGRIEHAQLLHDSDLARFAALGVTASVQPEHAMDDRDVAERYWPGRTRRAFALRPLLDALDIVLIPNANPDGRDLGRRTNANGVNLNTDFVRAREPEARALLQALARYEPDAVLDSHESAVLKRKSLGIEGWLTDFEIQFETANNPGVPTPLRELGEGELLPALLAATSTADAAAHRYIGEITSARQPITNGGLTLRNFRNTAGVQNRVSILVETRLDSGEFEYPTWRNIATREARQLHCLRAFLAVVHSRRAAIRAATAQPVRGGFALHASYQPALDHPRVAIGLRRRDTGELVLHHFADHRRVALADAVEPPAAYLVTAARDLIRPVLDAQGIAYRQLDAPHRYRVLEARFKLPAAPGGRATLLHSTTVAREAPTGSLVIELAQRRGRQAVLLLDPRSTSSLFRYPEFAARLGAEDPPPVYPVPATTGGNR